MTWPAFWQGAAGGLASSLLVFLGILLVKRWGAPERIINSKLEQKDAIIAQRDAFIAGQKGEIDGLCAQIEGMLARRPKFGGRIKTVLTNESVLGSFADKPITTMLVQMFVTGLGTPSNIIDWIAGIKIDGRIVYGNIVHMSDGTTVDLPGLGPSLLSPADYIMDRASKKFGDGETVPGWLLIAFPKWEPSKKEELLRGVLIVQFKDHTEADHEITYDLSKSVPADHIAYQPGAGGPRRIKPQNESDALAFVAFVQETVWDRLPTELFTHEKAAPASI